MKKFLSTTAFAALAFSSATAGAQTPAAEPGSEHGDAGHVTIEEIIVTAQRRETRLQDTPLAVTAISGAALERQPLTDTLQLGQRIPALVLTQRFGVLQAAIRGVGGTDLTLGSDPRVAFHVDGVYISRGAAQVSGLYDVDRVEVVQGPQGTLYGRNATAGAINVITRAPTKDFSGYVRQTIGNYGLFKTDAAINVPLGEEVALRVATEIINRDGFGRAVLFDKDIDDHKSKAVRARLRWDHGPLEVDLSGDFYHRRDRAFSAYYAGFIRRTPTQPAPPFLTPTTIVPTGARETSSDVLPYFKIRTYGGALNVKYELSDELTFQSLSGYRKSDLLQYADGDNTNILFTVGTSREHSETFSQEFQLNGEFGSTQFTLGAFGFDEKLETAVYINRAVAGVYRPAAYIGAKLPGRAYALYGTLTQNITDDFKIILGGRYTWETRKARRGRQGLLVPGTPVPVVTDFGQTYEVPDSLYQPELKQSWKKFTPSVTLQYNFSPDVMIYASYLEGFKSGAYNAQDLLAPVNPETIKDIEGGIKSTWLDGTLRANLSAFYYDYTDLQVSRGIVLPGPPPLSFVATVNAADATSYGVQLELQMQPSDNLRFTLDGLYVKSTFDEFSTTDSGLPPLTPAIDLAGADLPNAPRFKISLAGDYSKRVGDGELSLRVQSTFTDSFHTSVFNIPELAAPPVVLLDASIQYAMDNGFSASLWSNNFSDRRALIGVSPGNFGTGNPLNLSYGPPRTYGVTIGYKW